MNTMTWFGQSVWAMILLVPAWLAIPFFSRNFNVKGPIFLIWYMLAVVCGSVVIEVFKTKSFVNIFPKTVVLVVIVLIGFFLGALANSFLFQAVSTAPNPGLPVTIANVASVIVFMVAVICSLLFPKYFDKISFNYTHFFGIILTLSGLALIALKR